jgi:integrase/recombinase XerD
VRGLWRKYAATADITAAIHQLRHSHATELVNDGVLLQTSRKRLGHRNLQTTLRYAEQSDITADNELRARQRRCGRLTKGLGRRPAPERDPSP